MSWPGWLCNWLHDGGWKHAGYSPQDWCKAQVGMQPSFYDLFHPQALEHGSEALRFSATGFYSWCSDMGCMNPSVAWGTSTVYGKRNSQRVLLEPSIQPYFCSQLHFYLSNNSQSSYLFIALFCPPKLPTTSSHSRYQDENTDCTTLQRCSET